MSTEVEELASEKVAQIIEAALLAAEGPVTVDGLFKLFRDGELGAEEGRKKVRQVLKDLQANNSDRGIELVQVASGYRFQARQDLSPWVSRLWDEKPPRYTRALLETLAIITYKQPVTRGDIEQIRGVGVSQNIMRTLLERDWIKIVGQREAPGRPAIYGTTKAFLDYFGVRSLDQLPPLDEIREMIEPVIEAEKAAAEAAAKEMSISEVTSATEAGRTAEAAPSHEDSAPADDNSLAQSPDSEVTEGSAAQQAAAPAQDV
ncbi:MAG: SMC-Scp complex subunit ScpB [Gammaproteobacteria bacterium]|nr:SMC-Scp complex subunit ScpB [Gammaproteobacteria bacterium]